MSSPETGTTPGPRHVLAEIFYDSEDAEHPVKTQPRMICLNSVNGDTVQWYAAGGEFTVDLGNRHPFDFNGTSIELARGQFSPVLRFRRPGQPTGMPVLPGYKLHRGRGMPRTVAAPILTAHGAVIFDP